jgi:hypothetical protein
MAGEVFLAAASHPVSRPHTAAMHPLARAQFHARVVALLPTN